MKLLALVFFSFVAVATKSSRPCNPKAQAWATSANGTYKLSKFEPPVLGGGPTNGNNPWKFSINEHSGRKQVVKGFGASVTDGTVIAFDRLSSRDYETVMRDLMTAGGINLSLMRHTIASSDLSLDPAYSYDDNDGKPDPNLSHFSIGQYGKNMTRMLRQMKHIQPEMVLLGSPWSPPGWMQLDGVIMGSEVNNSLDLRYADAFARYFVKYIEAYAKAGVHVDAITLQNEPLANKAGMPSMYIGGNESAYLIRDHVGPMLRKSRLQTEIWAFDHNTGETYLVHLDNKDTDLLTLYCEGDYEYPESVARVASDFVSASAWHCYEGNTEPGHWDPLTRFHDKFPHLDQYMTECYTARGHSDWIFTSTFTMQPLQNWANGIMAWALGTWTEGGPALAGSVPCHICTGLITVDTKTGSWTKEVDYYLIGQYSKFIARGGHIVNSTGSHLDSSAMGIQAVASINPDGTRTVVIENRFNQDMWVELKTESEDKTWHGRVIATGLTTWVLPRKS